MVLQKRLDYGFSGYQVPVVPRASRSARGRGPVQKKACGKNLHHIVGININGKQGDEEESINDHHREKRSCNLNSFARVPGLQVNHGHQSCMLKEFLPTHENCCLNISSVGSKTCDKSEGICFAETSSRVVGNSSCLGVLSEGRGLDIPEKKEEDGLSTRRNERIHHVIGSLGGLMETDQRFDSLKTYVKVPLLEDCMNLGSFPRGSAGKKVVSKDDDENFVRCTQLSTITEGCVTQPFMRDQRIKKVSASKRTSDFKGTSPFGNDGNCNRRDNFFHERSERMYPFKKRKFFNQSPSSTSDRGFQYEDILKSSDGRVDDDNYGAAIAASSSTAGRQSCRRSQDCNVKLSIKSFRVPELFIEIPETATIGSLKRTVMQAVTSILGDELHVGILLQGKKVRDDSKTLIQTGISQDEKRQRLGFMLEPRCTQSSPPQYNEDSSFLSTDSSLQSSRLQLGVYNASREPPQIKVESCVGGNLSVVPSLADTSTDNTNAKCRALVAVPSISMKALAMVPFHRKSRNPDFVQRRIRRPFSVSEVEALVQAVEKLGTGRWRDVKLRAFDNAKHRTYVDLKDKWKTLVHTARISPQQRRGEPVPQELLDRVLAGHAYWSQQQSIKAV
ncbi:Telomere repeat-binding protein [Quillaja saponaria]|uniref:Telomere repeat-binding protein n=1 Tax=Quillaja saponaria TaxID=32244 RepID=A0AAD7PMN5_QUISA|nr:Telomere repeat-binding protein [Quillaja saponaria]KAJ7961407.1 Telomere repeat-binding protein [Quillaja saponaria]